MKKETAFSKQLGILAALSGDGTLHCSQFLNQDAFATAMNQGYLWVSHWLDWLYLLVGLAFVAVAAFIYFPKREASSSAAKTRNPSLQHFSGLL